MSVDDFDPHPDDLAEILDALVADAPRPTAKQCIAWQERYPHFREEIASMCAELLLAARVEDLKRRVAEFRAQAKPGDATLAGLAQASGTDLPALAASVGFPVLILAQIDAGHVAPPTADEDAIVGTIASTLGVDERAVAVALAKSQEGPRIANAKAAGAPSIVRLTFRDAVLASDMPGERKAEWLRPRTPTKP